MARTYELAFVVDPREPDEEVQSLIDKYSEMVTSGGAEVTHVDYWGKRKLAYPIHKLNEGKYAFLYITAPDAVPPFPDIERLMRQNDKVLRYLTVRTDEDLQRAERKGKVKPPRPGSSEGSSP